MQITIDVSEEELKEVFKDAVHDLVRQKVYSRYRDDDEFNHRTYLVIRESIREVLKNDKEHLAKVAVDAAAVSIKNEAVKKYLKKLVAE